MTQQISVQWTIGLTILAVICVPFHAVRAQATDEVGPFVYVLKRVEQTRNSIVATESPGLNEYATPFGTKNSTIKYYRRFSFKDGKINVILKDKKNVGAIDNPKMIRFGQEAELNIEYGSPPKILQPGQNILIPVSWSAKAQIGCYKAGGIGVRLSIILYEINDRKEHIAQENLRASRLRLSREELKKNCKTKSKISKKASGSSELVLKLSAKVPTKSLIIRMEGPSSLGMLYHYALQPANDVQLAKAEPVAVIIPCRKLEDKTRRLSADLDKANREWHAFQQDYLDFYDASKFGMSEDFDKVYYEAPGYIPFSSTINAIIKIEKNQRLRHFPQIKITAPKDYRNKAIAVLNTISDYTGYAGKLGVAASNVIGGIGKWDAFMGQGRRELVLPYDEGLKVYREMMVERQGTLDNYRVVMDHMFCKKVFKLEQDLYRIRTKTIPRSSCPANVKEALIGFAVRNTQYRNERQLQTGLSHCASKMN